MLVKFIGYTDDAPLTERNERIYGNHVGLSRAQARRVALAVQQELELATSAVDSDGRGATRPLGSNATAQGRALNRRVEVEFWYDDPLQELPDEPQLCPAPGTEMVTRVYDPPWGPLPELAIENGAPVVPAGFTELLRRGLADVAGRPNARLRFVGYTRNERLERRTTLVYGDDIGLSAARARRTMEAIAADMQLAPQQVEFEGRGYVHSDDVVNAGFVQGETSHVVVQIVYDEVAELDDYDGVDITPMTRELTPAERVRAEPDAHHRRRRAARRQGPQLGRRPALHGRRAAGGRHPVRLRQPRGRPAARRRGGARDRRVLPRRRRLGRRARALHDVRELRALHRARRGADLRARAVARGRARRRRRVRRPTAPANGCPSRQLFATPARELKYVLRAYGSGGTFDETVPQTLWIAYREAAPRRGRDAGAPIGDGATRCSPRSRRRTRRTSMRSQAELAVDRGDRCRVPRRRPRRERRRAARRLRREQPGAQQHPARERLGDRARQRRAAGPQVYVAGRAVPVDANGNFVAQEILPSGVHTVEVAMLDPQGNGNLYLRDIELERNDWFYVGMADVTLTRTTRTARSSCCKARTRRTTSTRRPTRGSRSTSTASSTKAGTSRRAPTRATSRSRISSATS